MAPNDPNKANELKPAVSEQMMKIVDRLAPLPGPCAATHAARWQQPQQLL